MTMEHRRQASKVTPANSRAISACNCPVQRAGSNPKSSPISAQFCKRTRPFLTESAPQTEFGLSHSKQRVGKFLAEARTPIRILVISPISAPFCEWFGPFLLDSALPVEFRVTYSKQTTGKILPDTRTHTSVFGILPISAQNPGPQPLPKLPRFPTPGAPLTGTGFESLARGKSSNCHNKLSEEIAWLRQ